MIGIIALTIAVAIVAIVWNVWKYRRDLILGVMAAIALRIYNRRH
jgi:hypothetical protein